jgi:hypothetical protein
VVAGEAGPGVQGAGERERGAVVHVAAAVADDELVLGVEGAAFCGRKRGCRWRRVRREPVLVRGGGWATSQ